MKKIIKKAMILIVLLLITLIGFKSSQSFKKWFNNNILNKTLSFATINQKYQSFFGSSIPFKELVDNSEMVFSEKLVYSKKEKYLDGVALTVSDNYLIPNIEKGLVIFVGKKEKYGLCVIIQQIDSTEAMYCNISNVAVKLYDYLDAGMLIGEVSDNKLLLSFHDNNGIVSYEKYI